MKNWFLPVDFPLLDFVLYTSCLLFVYSFLFPFTKWKIIKVSHHNGTYSLITHAITSNNIIHVRFSNREKKWNAMYCIYLSSPVWVQKATCILSCLRIFHAFFLTYSSLLILIQFSCACIFHLLAIQILSPDDCIWSIVNHQHP